MAEDDILKPALPDENAKPDQDTPIQLPELTELDLLSTKVVELESSVNQFKDQLLRKAAEFENYKKRIENDYATMVKYSNEDLIEKLLPVLDDFERSFNALRDHITENESFIKGIELIYQKFKRVLDLQGVKPLEAVGKSFDPELHDALLQIPSNEHPPHTVIQEVEKGYTLHDRVIRHARVIVSAEPASDNESFKNSISEID